MTEDVGEIFGFRILESDKMPPGMFGMVGANWTWALWDGEKIISGQCSSGLGWSGWSRWDLVG